MWTFTTDGFYSAVQHREDKGIMVVRCRKAADAFALQSRLLERGHPEYTVKHTPEGDYAYRLFIPRTAWAQYLIHAVESIDYPNFKDAVAERQGLDRADVYHDVWQMMLEYQTDV
jgi:hypothetical protein